MAKKEADVLARVITFSKNRTETPLISRWTNCISDHIFGVDWNSDPSVNACINILVALHDCRDDDPFKERLTEMVLAFIPTESDQDLPNPDFLLGQIIVLVQDIQAYNEDPTQRGASYATRIAGRGGNIRCDTIYCTAKARQSMETFLSSDEMNSIDRMIKLESMSRRVRLKQENVEELDYILRRCDIMRIVLWLTDVQLDDVPLDGLCRESIHRLVRALHLFYDDKKRQNNNDIRRYLQSTVENQFVEENPLQEYSGLLERLKRKRVERRNDIEYENMVSVLEACPMLQPLNLEESRVLNDFGINMADDAEPTTSAVV
eukprot:GHVH01008904.1.p1 GENE.GHVH01008904.1~~GHVH01008904.1.p1  ORF type:complete len:319 (-),score=32.42 GHVH01008904.1:221-1177(-)